MNDAYTTPPTQADAKLLAEFNAGVQRARDEYEAHPIAACQGDVRIGGETLPCDRIANSSDRVYCVPCLRAASEAARRMRVARAAS